MIMQRWLKILLSLVLLIVVAYWLLIDIAIKTFIEREGSNAVGAQLSIDAATFHLFPTTLTLRNLQVTDARAPIRNAMQAETVSLPLQLSELLDKQLIVTAMQIHGLRFNQPRAQSGALTSTAPSVTDAALSAQQRAQRHKQLREALQRIDAALANPLTVADTQAAGSITGVLLGDTLKPLLAQIVALLTPAQNSLSNDWHILLQHIDVDGQLDLGTQPLSFTGTVENLSPQPQHFDTVTRFNLTSTANQTGQLTTSGLLDFRKLANASVRFDLSALPVRDMPLGSDSDLTISIGQAVADVQGLLSLTGNQIDLNVLAHFREAALHVATSDEPELQTIATVLKNTTAFDLNLQANGDVQNPVLKLNSSLDQPLATALLRLQQRQQQSAFPASSGGF
jgi:hypothetical protein